MSISFPLKGVVHLQHMCRSAQILEDLLKRVSAVHERLRGMQPSYAALLYIVDAQQCEGYGEEYFNGKVSCFLLFPHLCNIMHL